MKSLKPCCALCPARGLLLFTASQTSNSISKAKGKLHDNHLDIIPAFVTWWQASCVMKAAGDCTVLNASLPTLFVPVSVL